MFQPDTSNDIYLDEIAQELLGRDIAECDGDTSGTNFYAKDGYIWVSADSIAHALRQAFEAGASYGG